MLNKLLLLLAFTSFSFLSLAQNFPEDIRNSFKRVVYLSEMHYFDSANAVLDSLEQTIEPKDSMLVEGVFLVRHEIASKSGDCKTRIEIVSKWLEVFHHRISQDSLILSSAYNGLGLDYKCMGRMAEAIEYFKKAIEYDPNTQFLYSNMAGSYIALGEYKMGLEALTHCTDTTDSSHPSAMILKGKCLYELAKQAEAKALLLEQIQFEKYRNNVLAHTTLGDIYMAAGEQALACEHYKKAKLPEGSSFQNHPNNGDYRLKKHLQDMMELQLKIKKACN